MDGRQFVFRKSGNHITGISDIPDFDFGSLPYDSTLDPTKFVEYRYNSAGDLISVRDRTSNVTEFVYEQTATGQSTHRLIRIKDSRDVDVLKVGYVPGSNMLSALADASGKGTTTATSPFKNGQTVQSAKDAGGGKSEVIYNEYGDVVREIQQIRSDAGEVTGYRVTVHTFEYGATSSKTWEEAEKLGVSNLNKLRQTQDFTPFVIDGEDKLGLRYTAEPLLKGAKVVHEVNYKVADTLWFETDDLPQLMKAVFQPESELTLGSDGRTRTTNYLSYWGPGKPTIVQDPHGSLTWMRYDNQGNLTHTINAFGEGTESAYDTQGRVTATYRIKVDPSSRCFDTGKPIVPQFTEQDCVGAALSTSTYYPSNTTVDGEYPGELRASTDAAGLTTRYTYYAAGTSAAGQVKAVYREWAEGTVNHSVRDSLTEYDDAGRVSKVTDAQDNVTETHYNQFGQVAYTVDKFGGKTAMVYDARGQVIRTIYPDGTETRTAYDALGRAEWASNRFYTGASSFNANGVPDAASNTAASLVTRTIYNPNGQAIGTERYKDVVIKIEGTAAVPSAINPNAATLSGKRLSSTATVYDDKGRVKETKDAVGLITQTDYFDNGQVEQTRTISAGVPSPWTTYEYDSKVINAVKQEIHDATDQIVVSYDQVTDANDHATTTYKDAIGRTIRTTYHDGSFVDVKYGPLGLTSTSKTYDQRKSGEAAVYTERQYDLAGRLTDLDLPAVLDATASDDPTTTDVDERFKRPHWHYTYDANGNELTQTDPRGKVTTFEYDDLNRRTWRTMPSDGDGNTADDKEGWEYDALGQLDKHIDFKGQSTKYLYNNSASYGGRLDEEHRFTGAASGTPNEKTVYHYDTLGRRDVVTEYANGNMTAPSRSSAYEFDPITGAVAQVTMTSGSTVQSVLHHDYDPATGRLNRTWTDNNDTTYRYDAMGRLSHVIVNKLHGVALGTSQAPARTTTYAYDPVGSLDLTTFDNGTPADLLDDLKHDYAYDTLNRLDTLTVKRGTTTLFDQDYDYESDGQKDKVTEHRGNITTAYDWTYDALNRLTDEGYTNGGDAAKNYAAHYAFDLAGNRVGKTQTGADAGTTASTYNDRNELATTKTNNGTEVVPQYDPNGNTLSDGTLTYAWDLRNRMASVTKANVTTAYTYDENGVRTSKQTGTGPLRTFVNDPSNPTGYSKPMEERLGGTLDASYVLGLGVLGQQSAANTQGYLSLVQDGQGKARGLISLSGVDLQAADYDAYGNALQADLTATPWQNPDGFTDFESGLTQQLARSLNRQNGTWVSEDSTIFGAGQHRDANIHLYVGGSPIVQLDPSGHEASLSSVMVAATNLLMFGIRVGAPIMRIGRPIAMGLTAYTFMRDPMAAQEFIATGGNPKDIIEDLLHSPALLAKDAKSILLFGRTLLQDARAIGLGTKQVNRLAGALSAAEGNFFLSKVLESLGTFENMSAFNGIVRGSTVRTVPDLPIASRFGVTEVKNVVELSFDSQLRAQADIARRYGVPFNLIISPSTKTISGPLQTAITTSGGMISRFDSQTGKWDFPQFVGNRVQ